MSYTEICNVPWLYIFVTVILLGCLAQTVIMMRKAWKHALELGLDNAQIRKGLANGVIVSIIPTIPVIVVFLALVPLLGTPLPWLRLSVIGSATFESMASSIGVESVGEQLVVGGYSIKGWIAACWCMSIGGSTALVWSTFATKPISKLYGAAEKFNLKLVLVLGTGCLTGVMAYSTVAYGLNSMADKGIVFISSFALGAVMVALARKFPEKKWINDSLMAVCMIFGMIIACVAL